MNNYIYCSCIDELSSELLYSQRDTGAGSVRLKNRFQMRSPEKVSVNPAPYIAIKPVLVA